MKKYWTVLLTIAVVVTAELLCRFPFQDDALGASIMSFGILLPLAGFICGMKHGKDAGWVKFIVPVVYFIIATCTITHVNGDNIITYFTENATLGLHSGIVSLIGVIAGCVIAFVKRKRSDAE